MSQQINEEQEPRDVTVVQVAPGAASPVITTINGKCGIPVLIAPFSGQQSDAARANGDATAQEPSMAFQGFLLVRAEDKKSMEEDDSPDAQRQRWFKEMRGWLMVLATVAASASYQAGLNPPGGFWQDDPQQQQQQARSLLLHAGGNVVLNITLQTGHHAGDPVLRDEHHSRYLLFYYFNATAFITSLVIMVLLMSERFYHTEAKVVALMFTTIVDLASLIGAYTSGTTRYFSSCIYIIVITCVAFVGVICIGEVMTVICYYVMVVFPCMETLVAKKWCPILPGVLEDARKKKEERRRRKSQGRQPNDSGTTSNARTCCMCCA